MKSCTYCGRANDAVNARCIECGTPFSTSEDKFPNSDLPSYPRLRGGAQAVIGFVLVASTAMVVCSRFALDMAVAEHGGPIGKPGIYAVGMLAFFYSVIALIFVLPLLVAACVARFGLKGWGISFGGLLLITALFSVRGLKFLLPAYLFGGSMKFAGAYYLGAAIQLGLGIWLLKSARLQPKSTSSE